MTSLRNTLFTILMLPAAALCAGKPGCTPSSVIVTVSSTYQDPTTLVNYNAAIRPDGLGDYTDGVDGVAAVIRDCPNGSGDATLNFSNRRPITVDLRNAVATNSSTPTWAGTPGVGGAFINIRNVMYLYSSQSTYSFTTRMALQAPQNPNYYFHMANPGALAAATPNNPSDNTPCVTSLVNVVHYPATSTTKETWVVWPDSSPASCSGAGGAQVGTLLYSNTSPWTNAGQFSVPFYITIRRK